MNDVADYEQEVGNIVTTIYTATGMRYALWLSARRGGYEGTVEDIGELVSVADMDRVLEAVLALAGPEQAAEDDAAGGAKATPPADGPG